jgi:hypothetical protein
MSEQKKQLPTDQMIEDYNLLTNMLSTLSIQVAELSKKKPDDQLNLIKIKMINRVLKPLKEELFVNEPSVSFLDELDETDMPSNSDALFIMSQYKTAAKEFVKDHRTRDGWWKTQEQLGIDNDEEDCAEA